MFTNTLPVFSFNSGRNDRNHNKTFLIPCLTLEKEIKPMLIKKSNGFLAFKLRDFHFLDMMKFVGDGTILNFF